LQRCDALDGKQDGRIDAPRECKVDFGALAKTPDGLTTEQAATVQSLYGGVQDASGRIVFPALEPGSEFFAEVWLASSVDRTGWGILASDGYRRLLSASVDEPATGIGAPIATMQSLIARSKVPALTDAKNPDLRPFARSDGKLLIYHGLADPLVIPKPMEDYYDRAAQKSGGKEALRRTARMFMVPGWGHCWERPSLTADDFDPLAALESWVERGAAPSFLELRSRDGKSTEQLPMR
jgi:feruloyl esterase